MLKLSKKSEYGIIALKHMLNQPGGQVTRAKDIANAYNIPSEVMAKILQQLVKSDIIQSSQGARGGYELAKVGEKITLSEIIECIEGPVDLVECVGEGDCDCVQLSNCNISEPFKAIQQQFERFLSGISLADINNEIEIQKVVWH